MRTEDHAQPEPQQAEDMHSCHVRTVTDVQLGDASQDTREALLEALDAVPREQFENARSVANFAGMGREKAEAKADRLLSEDWFVPVVAQALALFEDRANTLSWDRQKAEKLLVALHAALAHEEGSQA